MFIDISQLKEITINGKKVWLNDESMRRMITSDVDKSFGDIHNYTVGENISIEDTEEMIKLMNNYQPSAPVEIQYLLLEFIEKYYKDPVEEILRLVGSPNVRSMYNYFLYGPCHYSYDLSLLEYACEYSLIEMGRIILPEYLWQIDNRSVHVICGLSEIEHYGGTNFIIPSERYAKCMDEDDLHHFRQNAFSVLAVIALHKGLYFYKSICGIAFSERLFNINNFDLAEWPSNESPKKKKVIPKRLPVKEVTKKKASYKEAISDDDEELSDD